MPDDGDVLYCIHGDTGIHVFKDGEFVPVDVPLKKPVELSTTATESVSEPLSPDAFVKLIASGDGFNDTPTWSAMPDDYEKRVADVLHLDYVKSKKGASWLMSAPDDSKWVMLNLTKEVLQLATLLREADRNGERRGRIAETRRLVDPKLWNFFCKTDADLIKRGVGYRLTELKADSVEKEQ